MLNKGVYLQQLYNYYNMDVVFNVEMEILFLFDSYSSLQNQTVRTHLLEQVARKFQVQHSPRRAKRKIHFVCILYNII